MRVCRRIRERFSLLDLPILILTAKVQVQSITESLKCGANDYLNKPFDAEELKARSQYSLQPEGHIGKGDCQ